MCKVTGKDVAKVSSGSHESDFVTDIESGSLLRKLEIRVVVKHDLGENPREVNGVDSTQL